MHPLETSEVPEGLASPRWRIAQKILLVLLAFIALVSIWGGVKNALTPGRSQDFQWSGAHMVLEHIDPWKDYLNGDPAHEIFRLQIPNYLPLMYVLLAPLGLLSIEQAGLVWVTLNILFALVSGLLCGRFYGLGKTMSGILVTLLLLSTPMRNTMGNGQQGLLVLFIWVLALCRTPQVKQGLTIGFSYFKYSFAPPVFLFLLLRLGIRAVLLSLVPAVASLLIVYAWLGGSLLHPGALLQMIVEPLKVAGIGYFGAPGPNLMDALEWALAFTPVAHAIARLIVYAVPVAIAVFLLFRFARRSSTLAWEWQIALLAVLSLALFKHHSYDGVVLLFPMAFCLKHLRQVPARWAVGLLCYPWYGDKLLRNLGWLPNWSFLFDLVILAVIGMAVSQVRSSVTE